MCCAVPNGSQTLSLPGAGCPVAADTICLPLQDSNRTLTQVRKVLKLLPRERCHLTVTEHRAGHSCCHMEAPVGPAMALLPTTMEFCQLLQHLLCKVHRCRYNWERRHPTHKVTHHHVLSPEQKPPLGSTQTHQVPLSFPPCAHQGGLS